MQIEFLYVDNLSLEEVTLHLFRTLNGTPRADVTAPRDHFIQGTWPLVEAAVCQELPGAFAIAIRMANMNDVSVVVTGDATLWSPNWGKLTFSDRNTVPALRPSNFG